MKSATQLAKRNPQKQNLMQEMREACLKAGWTEEEWEQEEERRWLWRVSEMKDWLAFAGS